MGEVKGSNLSRGKRIGVRNEVLGVRDLKLNFLRESSENYHSKLVMLKVLKGGLKNEKIYEEED